MTGHLSQFCSHTQFEPLRQKFFMVLDLGRTSLLPLFPIDAAGWPSCSLAGSEVGAQATWVAKLKRQPLVAVPCWCLGGNKRVCPPATPASVAPRVLHQPGQSPQGQNGLLPDSPRDLWLVPPYGHRGHELPQAAAWAGLRRQAPTAPWLMSL